MSRAAEPQPGPDGLRYRTLAVWVIAVLLAIELVSLLAWLVRAPQPPFSDFFGLWSFAKFVRLAGLAIYHPVALQTFQQHLDPALHGSYPCPYPPSALLLLAPFGMLPLPVAYGLWVGATVALYVVATLGRDWRSIWGAALLAAPTTLLTVTSGQNGFLTAALLVGGLRLLPRSWLLSGVAFGLLTYKPQFGVLVPVVLLATRNVRAFVATIAMLGLLVLASGLAFGWSIWPAWMQGIPQYRDLLASNQSHLGQLMPTVLAGLRQIGVSEWLAYAAQLAVALVVAIVVWRRVGRRVEDRGVAATVVASFLATPYAFIYDMPMITAALVLAARRRVQAGIALKPWEIVAAFGLFASVQWMDLAALPLVVPALLAILLIALCAGNHPRAAASGQAGTSGGNGVNPPPPAGPWASGAASPPASAATAAAAGLSRSTSCGSRR